MHHPSPMSSKLGFLPAMYSFPGLVNIPEIGINIGPTLGTSHHLPGVSPPNTSWERRCLRKHRRRADDEGCSAKKRRLMGEAGGRASLDDPSPSVCQSWPLSSIQPPVPVPTIPAVPQPCSEHQSLGLPVFMSSSPQPCPETDSSCMEMEAAQRRLQEIEERITLEDDDEDLDVEPAQRRPVLVMSDSLREGLQRGMGDILPHKVAQSMSQSCMQLVVWRPPEDALARRLKDSLQRQQRRQQTTCRQPPTPGPSPTQQVSLAPTAPLAAGTEEDMSSPLYHVPGALSFGEEEMEL